MEAVSTYETYVNFYESTRRKTPKDNHVYYSRCDDNAMNEFSALWFAITNIKTTALVRQICFFRDKYGKLQT
jgi:hypothetical protein